MTKPKAPRPIRGKPEKDATQKVMNVMVVVGEQQVAIVRTDAAAVAIPRWAYEAVRAAALNPPQEGKGNGKPEAV